MCDQEARGVEQVEGCDRPCVTVTLSRPSVRQFPGPAAVLIVQAADALVNRPYGLQRTQYPERIIIGKIRNFVRVL